MTDLLKMSPTALLDYMEQEFSVDLPSTVETVNDMKEAGRLLGVCTANYSFLDTMAMRAKVIKKQLKNNGAEKAEIDDALSREEIFSKYAEHMKMDYNTVSRMITVKQQINDELKMTDGR